MDPPAFTIATKVLTNKKLNLGAIKSTLIQAWHLKGNVQVNEMEKNTLAFIFDTKEDWEKMNMETAKQIGDSVGQFINADLGTNRQKWNKHLRVRVEIDVAQPLTQVVSISLPSKQVLKCNIKFERLGDFCYRCGLLDHKKETCTLTLVDENNQDLPFGEWLRAESYESNRKVQPERSHLLRNPVSSRNNIPAQNPSTLIPCNPGNSNPSRQSTSLHEVGKNPTLPTPDPIIRNSPLTHKAIESKSPSATLT
ncbi:hypothetical protein CDL12_25179 [Handroanthus impetiginosus]|uniref:Zinc knuckle CX2CX4HX4C domain-containing protein n=1 Tax=Handroanthus impetiginosus TaxID=429701 RepID=A0A2G9GAH2_9LAMI|nr:hypothetical protein CDL12_25179 [Handroanthus impetiginosus]